MPDIPTIVIPTYNEKENIEKLVKTILKTCENKVKILIVDDNSPDGTGRLANQLKKRYKNVDVLHRIKKKGLGSAILDGFYTAKTDIIGVMDADFSHPIKLIPKMLETMENKDMIIASRYVKGGGTHESWTIFRKIISKGAILLARPLTGVKDTMSGFFFVRKDIINRLKLDPTSCKICLEIAVKGKIKNFKEVPYIFINRKHGKSKIMNSNEIFNYIKHVLSLYKHRITS